MDFFIFNFQFSILNSFHPSPFHLSPARQTVRSTGADTQVCPYQSHGGGCWIRTYSLLVNLLFFKFSIFNFQFSILNSQLLPPFTFPPFTLPPFTAAARALISKSQDLTVLTRGCRAAPAEWLPATGTARGKGVF